LRARDRGAKLIKKIDQTLQRIEMSMGLWFLWIHVGVGKLVFAAWSSPDLPPVVQFDCQKKLARDVQGKKQTGRLICPFSRAHLTSARPWTVAAEKAKTGSGVFSQNAIFIQSQAA